MLGFTTEPSQTTYQMLRQQKKRYDTKLTAFNQKTNSVIYRLSVNADGVKNIGAYTNPIKVKDILPEGWEFVNIKDSKKYVIFKGTARDTDISDDADINKVDEAVIA